MVGIVLLGIFVLLLAFGAPIAVCLGMSSVGAILVQGAGKPLDAIMSVLPRLCSSASSKFVLLAIPFFILSGNVMEKAGISGRLINLAEKCLGHIRGGMAMVCVVVSCFFAAISGSGPATVAALGLIMIPALVKAGYPASFSCALMAAGGAIGVVIPPSITRHNCYFNEGGHLCVKNLSAFWLPEFTLQKEIGGTVYTVTGSYDGVETLDRKMERVMGEKFTEKMEDSE